MIVLILIFSQFYACTTSLNKELIGTWKMATVYELEENVTQRHNPANNRFFTFYENGTFKSGGDPFGENTGKWSLSEEHLLFIDSDAGEDDDSYWRVKIEQDTMKWQGAVFEFGKRFRIEHVR